jgi:peptide/nickel transport system substrate-binding protein
MPDSRPLRPGDPERLGGYRLIGLLGEGGQGVVYLAELAESPDAEEVTDGGSGSLRYAIKLLRTHLSGDPKARRYFAKEVAAAQRIDPSYTARIIEADVDGETPYIVSEYVDGRSLADVVRDNGPLSGPGLDQLAVGTLNALVGIHRAGVVHRDFKPSNVLLDPDGPRVIDFGIARAMDATMSVSSGIVGTPVYMAPEQLTGQRLTPAVDVFAWAATLVYAGAGAPPFGQDSIPAVMHRILNAEPEIGDLREPLRELIWRCLRRNPAQRPTAQEALARFTAAAVHGSAPGAKWAAPGTPAVPVPPAAPVPPAVPVPPAGPPPAAPVPHQMAPHQMAPHQVAPHQVAPHRMAPFQATRHQSPPDAPVPHLPASAGQAGPHAGWTPPPNGWTPPTAAPASSPVPGPAPGGVTTRPSGAASTGAGRRIRPWLPLTAAAAGVVLVAGVTIAAVRLVGSDDDPSGPPTPTARAGADAALTGVVRPSDAKGGTLKLVNSGDFDSLDPGNMYLAGSWDFSRLYARPLVTYTGGSGAQGGGRLTPDLASGLGQASPDLKTWTYRLRPGLKFEDGTRVTARDVRYAVARTFAVDVLFNGPSYFRDLLDAGDYAGPYKDGDLDGFTGVTAPDDRTVVFHLKEPYAEFDHLAALPQTAPVPQAKDTTGGGTDYATRPISTGPYKVESHENGKSVVLVRNPYWSADGIRKQLADRIEVALNVGADAADQRLLAGEADLDVGGTGLQPASVARALTDPNIRKNTDSAPTGFLRYVALSTKVVPFDNVHCRRAVQYAVDRSALVRTVYGGPQVAEAATSALPPVVAGRQRFEPYPLNEAKAKAELAACGRPSGFAARIAVRDGRPKDSQIAEALTRTLGRVGIRLEVRRYPVGKFFSDYAGRPESVHKNRLGMIVSAWGADFPAGLGFFPLLVDGRRILPTGNGNLSELNDPAINAMLDQAARTADRATREQLSAELDRKVMDSAAIVPLAYEEALLYRGSRLTNVYVNGLYGMYDYASLGVR